MTNITGTFVSLEEYAEMLGVSRDTVRRRVADGTIKAIRFGRQIRIDKDQPLPAA
jgi:excisionase family DNA binding protein